MNDAAYPIFLDVEASGFGPQSYPIEVAWSDPAGEIRRYLINPEPIAGWRSWDADAERVHGIERGRLVRNGWAPDYVATRIEEDLGGRTVYTDAPDFDAHWLRRLFEAVGRPLPCSLEHVDELLLATMRRSDEAIWQAALRIDALKRQVGALSSGKHSAGYDAGYLLQLWRAATGHAVKMNHGIGPMPPTTETGTFTRLVKPGQ